ncbi:MAG: aldehyde dehydrogenase family protein [Sphingomonadales bacterium]|nr:aldehyde dehydrogenase family protein [Sphingomonadales bacterium]
MNQPTTAAQWHARAAGLVHEPRPFINGAYRRADAGDTFDSVNPATGEVVARLPSCSQRDVDQAVLAARHAFDHRAWVGQGPLARKAVLIGIAERMEAAAVDLALMDCLEVGKPITSALQEVTVAASFFRYYGEALDKIYGAVAPSDHTALGISVMEPVGVVAAIVPWNFPIINASLKIAPALAAGNSVVLKPSEIASLSALALAGIAAEAGLPAGVLNVLSGLGHGAGRDLSRHADVDMVTFTGSTATGAKIMENSAAHGFKRVLLECGGKSPQVVFNDGVDLDAIAESLIQDAFWNQGQVCVARCRLLIEKGLEDQFFAAAADILQHWQPADPLDPATRFGAIAGRPFFDNILRHIETAKQDGARVMAGGHAAHQKTGGLFITPTVLTGVQPGTAILQQEVFGPVLTVQTFEGEDEALRHANDTQYGLAATIWTQSLARGVRMGRGVRAGKVRVQASAPHGEGSGFALASEPMGQSGFGVEFGMAGLKSYTTLKAIEFLV